jgi:glycosyltransferase involved in cell wall biosynthesis
VTTTASRAPLPLTVVHVVTSLELGGAQRMLAKLVAAPLAAPERTHVVSLLPAGPLATPIRAAGASVHSLGLGHGSVAPLRLLALGRLLRRLGPDLVQGWMYHGNLAASLAAPFGAGGAPVLWNIRGALDAPLAESRLTRWVIRAGAGLSARPAAIVYNAASAARQHAAAGYAPARAVVIGNGFDLAAYRPDPAAGPALRRRLGIADARPLVGIAAEVRPMKDHATLLAAIGRLAAGGHDLDLVMLGTGTTPDNADLVARIAANGLTGRVHLLGPLADPAPVIKGLDLGVLSSAWGEGFPNFVGEAMAAGVPCVATDTGDCRAIIGETGRVAPPRDPAALAAALETMLALPADARHALGLAARERIATRYGLPAIVDAYRRLYLGCIAARRGGAAAADQDVAHAA